MGLQYKVMTTFKPGEGKTGKQICFPKLTGTSRLDLHEIAEILAERSALSEGDVYSVVVGLVGLIPEKLMDGYTVKLDGLGTFRLHAKVTTSEKPKEVNVHDIKGLRITFKPDKEIKRELHVSGIKKMK